MRKSEKNGISEIKLIFFCGNPGREYSLTRHNAGWLLLEELTRGKSLSWQKKFNGAFSRMEKAESVILLKPDVFMNLAGECLAPAASFFRIAPGSILVCHDDIELDFGTVSVKTGGGSAGHNGLRSIEKMLGSKEFCRFRIGVSRPSNGKVDSHVLGRFSRDEEAVLPLYMELAARTLLSFIEGSSDNTPQDRENLSPGTKIRLLQ